MEVRVLLQSALPSSFGSRPTRALLGQSFSVRQHSSCVCPKPVWLRCSPQRPFLSPLSPTEHAGRLRSARALQGSWFAYRLAHWLPPPPWPNENFPSTRPNFGFFP